MNTNWPITKLRIEINSIHEYASFVPDTDSNTNGEESKMCMIVNVHDILLFLVLK